MAQAQRNRGGTALALAVALGGVAIVGGEAAGEEKPPARSVAKANEPLKELKRNEVKRETEKGAASAHAPSAEPVAAAPTAPPPAPVKPKPATYEAAREGAVEAGDLATFFEPLFGACVDPDPLARRQCELIKQWHVDRTHALTWVALADGSALQTQPWDAAEKSVTLVVTGCMACAEPPTIAGAPRLVATRPPRLEGGLPVGLDLSYHEVPALTAVRADAFAARLRTRLRTEFVFTVGQPFDAGPQSGVLFTPLAHRVYDRCTGEVIASEPPSLKPVTIAGRGADCPPPGAPNEEEAEELREQAALPDTLTRADIEKVMAPVQTRIYECGEMFDLRGVAMIKLSIDGEGRHVRMVVAPPFDKGDAYLCLRAAFREAKIPRFKSASPPVNIDFPFVWRK